MDSSLMIQVAAALRQSVRYVHPGTDTLQAAIDRARDGATLVLAPGEYEGNVIIPRTTSPLTIIGAGGRDAVMVAALTNGTAITNHADDLTLVNLNVVGNGVGGGIVNDGSRLRLVGCKVEGGADAIILSLGTTAQVTALTHGLGTNALLEDCEIADATNGVVLRCTSSGAVKRARVRGCMFRALTNHVTERVGSGGAAGVGFLALEVADCTFRPAEDGTSPTKYFDLNDDNANTGIVHGCTFTVAANSGLSLVSTAVKWVGNFYPAGISAGQPS